MNIKSVSLFQWHEKFIKVIMLLFEHSTSFRGLSDFLIFDMLKKFKLAVGLVALIAFSPVKAVQNYQTGVIFDHTSLEGLLLIRFDPAVTPLPAICAGSSSAWMAIPEANKALMAVTLMALAMNNRTMTVYSRGIGTSGYCELVQVDPEH